MLKCKYSAYILLLALALVSCKPEEIIPVESEPIFFANGTIGGSPISLAAGIENYYMFSSYELDSNDVYSFTADLKDSKCDSTCSNSLSIRFRNYKADANTSTAFSSSFSLPQEYAVFSNVNGSSTSLQVDFTPLTSGGQPSHFVWDFGDGETSTEATPQHIYTTPGIYEACLTASYINECSRSICNPINNGISILSCDALFSLTTVSGNTVSLSASPGGTAPFTYAWDFGDGSSANTQTVTHTYSSPGVYEVCLTSTSANGCTNTRCMNVATDNPGTCSIAYLKNTTSLPNPFDLATVVIEWKDANGIVYASNLSGQPNDGYFKVVSVEDHSNNELGYKTKKMSVEFVCTLYKEGNSQEAIQANASAVIAIAYP